MLFTKVIFVVEAFNLNQKMFKDSKVKGC